MGISFVTDAVHEAALDRSCGSTTPVLSAVRSAKAFLHLAVFFCMTVCVAAYRAQEVQDVMYDGSGINRCGLWSYSVSAQSP